MKRREFITLLGGAAAWPVMAWAQQAKLPTIGFLGSGTAATQSQWTGAFVQRLRELGWSEGRDVAIEYRWAEGRNERAAKIAGARSYILKGDAARLELALMNFAFDRIAHKGFTPLIVPAMAREFCFIGNGQFPKGRDQVYAIEDEDTFLVGTAEVSITGMYKDDILKAEDLPMTFVGYCPCFRKEAGTYGKDTRGVFRIHQFSKVEQYVICKADHAESVRWHEQLLANSEELVQALELPYRVVNVCTGDMGDGKVGMYDLECWLPSEGRYRETHSCSYFHEWQARRANIRYRDEDGKVKFVHTLNNTAIASPRIILPLLETHQQADGTVRIPAALRPYLGGQEYIMPHHTER